ncbi:MAG: hypothetical protein JSR82_08705 [Verrucomicrobia bacterium]|nr:hypothetical protein [Verrucomicrobiota bacterium]
MPSIWILRGLLLVASLQLAGCEYEYLPRFAIERPDSGSLVGRYHPDDDTETREWLSSRGFAATEAWIELHADGRFVFQRIPAYWLSQNERGSLETDTGTGTWELLRGLQHLHDDPRATRWGLFLRIKTTSADSNFKLVPFDHGAGIFVSRRKPPHTLSLSLSSGGRRFLTFQRQPIPR